MGPYAEEIDYLAAKRCTLVFPGTREELLGFFPTGAAAAEIGVARGAFSKRIKARLRPRHLVLIDPWAEDTATDYRLDSNNVTQAEQDRRHRAVRRWFRLVHPFSKVEIIRAASAEAHGRFAEGYFAFVYIDGNHLFEHVLADLAAWAAKTAPDGFLAGHDFALHAEARRQKFGVTAAVQAFLKGNPAFRLIAVTTEHFPTFVLTRAANIDSPFLRAYLRGTFAKIAVPEAAAFDFSHFRSSAVGRRRSALVAFEGI